MKKLLGLFMVGLLAAGMGCGKKESKPGAVTPRAVSEPVRGPNERFYTIQQKLDSGGNFYMYADLKDVLHNFMDKMQANFTGPQMPPEAAKAFMIANQVIDRLGLYGINDLGMSVVPDGSLKRSKIVISDANGRKKGLLSLLGGSPHPFPMLDRVSSDTLLLATGDLDTSASWALIRQITQDLGGIDALAQMDKALGQLAQQSGINVPAILPTLGGEFTLAMAQDRASKLSIPAGARPIVIDSPRLALMVRVKDDTLYQAFKTLLTQKARATETTDGKLRKVLIPAPSNPIWSVSPVLASDGSYVYLATHDDYLRQLTSAPAGASLRQAAEFKDLSQGLPTEGNALFFVSKQLKT